MNRNRIEIISVIAGSLLFHLADIEAEDLRVIGTNLYDFSQASPYGQKLSKYLLHGTVQSSSSNELVLTCFTSSYRMKPTLDPYGGPAELLRSMAEIKMAEHPMTEGQVMALSPELQGHVHRVERTWRIAVLNYPNRVPVGRQVDLLALPINDSNELWDFGVRIERSSATNFSRIIRVYADALIDERYDSKAMPRLAVDSLEWRMWQATNGNAVAQCDLGMDYLMGLGVETNTALGMEWIRKSAGTGYQEAVDFLRQRH